jgi:MFS transporter, ACS family, DAL5 transporter family protein
MTIIVACSSPLLVKDWPHTSSFLTETEREYVMGRLQRDVDNVEETFQFQFLLEAFKDPKMYIMVLIYLGVNSGTYAIAYFLPTIIVDLGYSAAQYVPSFYYNSYSAQLMTVPPYACACVATVGLAWLSDRLSQRGLWDLIYLD